MTGNLTDVLAPVVAQVLFMQGGASAQFAAVPLNLTRHGQEVRRRNRSNVHQPAGARQAAASCGAALNCRAMFMLPLRGKAGE